MALAFHWFPLNELGLLRGKIESQLFPFCRPCYKYAFPFCRPPCYTKEYAFPFCRPCYTSTPSPSTGLATSTMPSPSPYAGLAKPTTTSDAIVTLALIDLSSNRSGNWLSIEIPNSPFKTLLFHKDTDIRETPFVQSEASIWQEFAFSAHSFTRKRTPSATRIRSLSVQNVDIHDNNRQHNTQKKRAIESIWLTTTAKYSSADLDSSYCTSTARTARYLYSKQGEKSEKDDDSKGCFSSLSIDIKGDPQDDSSSCADISLPSFFLSRTISTAAVYPTWAAAATTTVSRFGGWQYV